MITEEELAQLLALNPDAAASRNANFDTRTELVKQQLAQAMAQQQASTPQHSTPLGALFGGAANALQTVRGIQQQRGAEDQLRQLGAERSAADKLDTIKRARVLRMALSGLGGGNTSSGEGSPLGGTAPTAVPGGAPGGNRIGQISAAGMGAPSGMSADVLVDALAGNARPDPAMLANLLRGRAGQELLAATSDPVLSRLAGLQLQDQNRADAVNLEDQRYARGRKDKLADIADERKYQGQRDARQNAAAEHRAEIMAAAQAARKAMGAQIPAGEAAQVGQYDAALKTLDALEQERQKKTGAFSGLAQYLPGTDAAQYDDAALSAAQTIGTILEGGKLTDADLPKYLRMLPTAGDSGERASEKVRRLREMIQNARASKVAGLSAAGFNTSGFASQGGKVRVSNGVESYLIDPSDLAEAERDGFKQVN